jgi:anti-sigma regulatory factor (Ser/Thr protein kinase)
MGLDWRHGLRLDSRLRAYAWPVFFALLGVDTVLVALFRDYTSSVGAAQLLEPALTIAVLGVALFAGPLFGLTAALFLGTVFYCFLASLPGPSEVGFTLGAIALWSGTAVALGALADRRRRRTEEIERTLGRKVVIPLPVSSAVELRAALRALLRSHEMDEGQGEMVVLATQEAYNNAVVHPPGVVEVSAQVFEQVVDVEVRDRGPGFAPAPLVPSAEPELFRDHGRGLFLMHELMDRVDIDSGRSGTVVRMRKQLGRPDEEEAPPADRAILRPLGRLLSRERSA